jgi:hypothetical protein
LLIDRGADGKQGFTNENEYVHKEVDELVFDSDGLNEQIVSNQSFSGCCSVELSEDNNQSPYIEKTFAELTSSDHAWIRVSAYVYVDSNDVANPFSLVTHFMYNGYPYKYRTIEAQDIDLIPNQWNKIQMDYLTPEVRDTDNKVRMQIQYIGNRKMYVDNLKAEVFVKE